MATVTADKPVFNVEITDRALGRNLLQRVGGALTLPMFFAALMFFAVGIALGVVRADKIAAGAEADTIEALRHLGPAFMFLGFAAVFSAISFAIARILGQFRKGGGVIQEAAGRAVSTLRMPLTARIFVMGMMISLATLVAASILHFVFAADVANTELSLADSEQRFLVLEGVRRAGVALFLFSIVLGLATIVRVLRFQAGRVRQLPIEPALSDSR